MTEVLTMHPGKHKTIMNQITVPAFCRDSIAKRSQGVFVMERSQTHYNRNRNLPEYISLISGSQCARIKINDIECIEQDGRKLHIITAEKDYTLYENMTTIIKSLAERAFFRPMKGLIINFDHVKDISGSFVNFYSGQSVTLGKNSASRTRQAFKKYLMRYPPYSLWEPVRRVSEVREISENYDFGWDVIEDERAAKIDYDAELHPDKNGVM